MFQGLPSLERLDVNMDRRLRSVEPGTLAKLPKLHEVSMSTNGVNVFNKSSFINSVDDKPNAIVITFDWGTDLRVDDCDKRLCWMKEGEKDGWLKIDHDVGPICKNYGSVKWVDVDPYLKCDQ